MKTTNDKKRSAEFAAAVGRALRRSARVARNTARPRHPDLHLAQWQDRGGETVTNRGIACRP